MPKLPPLLLLKPDDPVRKKRSRGLTKFVCNAFGEFKGEMLDSSKSLLAGDDIIDRDVMRLDITSGVAGSMCTRFVSGTRRFEDELGAEMRLVW